jgi:hypothetical protein
MQKARRFRQGFFYSGDIPGQRAADMAQILGTLADDTAFDQSRLARRNDKESPRRPA